MMLWYHAIMTKFVCNGQLYVYYHAVRSYIIFLSNIGDLEVKKIQP